MENEKSKVILDFLADDKYVPMKAKEIAFILGVGKERYAEFNEILQSLVNDYKIACTKKGKYYLVDENVYKTGTIRLNQKGFGFVKVENSEDEIFVEASNINGALNGDEVIVEVFDYIRKLRA